MVYLKLVVYKYFFLILFFNLVFCVVGCSSFANTMFLPSEGELIRNWVSGGILNVQNAVQIAFARNSSIEEIEAKIKQVEQEVVKLKSFYWPTVDFTVLANFSEGVKKNTISTKSYALELNASWVLFDGFKRKFDINAADYSKKMVCSELDNVRRLLGYAVSKLYYSAQLFLENISIAKSDEIFNQRKLIEINSRYQSGMVSLGDVINFEMKLNMARANRIMEECNYKVAMNGLASLLGISDPNFVSSVVLSPLVSEMDEELELFNKDLKLMIDYWVQRRPDVCQCKYSLKRAEALLNAAKASYYPTFFVSAILEGAKVDDVRFCRNDFSCNIQLGLNYNFFSGGMYSASLIKVLNYQIECKKKLEGLLLFAESEVRSAFVKICSAQYQLSLQRKNVKLAERILILVEKEYDNGQESLVRLNEIQNEFAKAKFQLTASITDLKFAWLEFKVTTNTLFVN